MPAQENLALRRIALAGLFVAFALEWGGCTTIESIFSPPPPPRASEPPISKEAPSAPVPKDKAPEAPQPVQKEPAVAPSKEEPPPPAPTAAPAPTPPPPPKKEPVAPPKKEPEAPQPVKREPEAPPAKKEPETPPPVLAPQVGKEGQEQLRRTATSRIQRTEQLIGQLEGKKLTNDQHEQLLTVQSLLGNAKEALVAQDLAKASNLADKARILVEELAQVVR